MYWYYDTAGRHMQASDKYRTQFRITARDLPVGTIMIGKDEISIHVDQERTKPIDVSTTRNLVGWGPGRNFKFQDLMNGTFYVQDGHVMCNTSIGEYQGKDEWELA